MQSQRIGLSRRWKKPGEHLPSHWFCGGKSYQELMQEIKFAQDYGISSAEIKNAIPHVLIANQQEVYQAIYGLLFKYGYDVPIISSRDGNEIVDVGQIYKTVEDEYEN